MAWTLPPFQLLLMVPPSLHAATCPSLSSSNDPSSSCPRTFAHALPLPECYLYSVRSYPFSLHLMRQVSNWERFLVATPGGKPPASRGRGFFSTSRDAQDSSQPRRITSPECQWCKMETLRPSVRALTLLTEGGFPVSLSPHVPPAQSGPDPPLPPQPSKISEKILGAQNALHGPASIRFTEARTDAEEVCARDL